MNTTTFDPTNAAIALPYRLAIAMHGLPAHLRDWLRRRGAVARTLRELNAMSDRGLADIGILRCDIRKRARETAG